MAIRRHRRLGRPRVLLPLRAADQRSSSISCWYCDVKIYAFNEFLYFTGQRHVWYLRSWFTIGVAFSFTSFLVITLMLLCESAAAFLTNSWLLWLKDLSVSWFWSTSQLVSSSRISIMDFAVMAFSTVISLIIHEFGHAVAAASEGVPIEYVAVFLAVIFPGALVAFNNDLLQMLPTIASLRIYCAGIWHNAMLSAVSKLAFFLLPFVLHPLCIHGNNPMVLGVSQSSSLYGFLSTGDVIVSVDGNNILSRHELIDKLVIGQNRLIPGTGSARKGYCVPGPWLQESKTVMALDDKISCPDGLVAFIGLTCLNSSLSFGSSTERKGGIKRDNSHCFSPEEVVKFNKCGDGWGGTTSLINHCVGSKENICVAPLLSPGMSWSEISYSNPYSSDCLNQKRNASFTDSTPGNGSNRCGIRSFVYIGDKFELVNSLQLSDYRPRQTYISWTAGLPTILESILTSICRVSAVLAVLNCFPVFFLDGQYILETALCYIPWLSPRRRRNAAAAAFLIGGTTFTAIASLRFIYFALYSVTNG